MKKNLPPIFSRIRSALKRRGATQDTDDYIQEAWARLASYEREQVVLEPEAFLMKTAINLSIDAHRSRVVHGEQVVLEEVVLVDDSPPVESIVLSRERMVRLEQCLARLGEKPRDMFMAHRLDGLTYREIADQHGLSISTVEKHIAKATLQLITWMEGW
ncbi:RNA polymerase sigma factor [Paucibacter sp. JuS9]|uniref:RNA polymerase sigma factor n=1 Tax=Paucibacter sp. JuS9 TaxID=3228748 RepID=UPI0037578B81